MDKQDKKTAIEEAESKYPGVAINVADDEKVDECLVRERTRVLDSNARTEDDKK